MAGKMASSESDMSIPLYEARECIEDILEKTAIKSNKVQEHLRLLGYRINTVSFGDVIQI